MSFRAKLDPFVNPRNAAYVGMPVTHQDRLYLVTRVFGRRPRRLRWLSFQRQHPEWLFIERRGQWLIAEPVNPKEEST